MTAMALDTETLQRLHPFLDAAAGYDPEYGGGLSNHQPMALLALARLGADGAHLAAYAADYAQRHKLRPTRPRGAWPTGEAWAKLLGKRRAWPMYLDLFEQWRSHEGTAALLAQVLPGLLPGCGAAAFHGLIRTAAGVQASHDGEVMQGLAHWATWHLPLGVLPSAPTYSPTSAPTHAPPLGSREPTRWPAVVDPAVLLRRLHTGTSTAGLIAQRMADAAAVGEVNRVAAQLLVDDRTPERLARAAAFAYAESGNFTALHLVTATHAMRVLARFVDEGEARRSAWRWFWQAFAHGVVSAKLRPAARPLALREWPTLEAAALAARDEHLIKLVDACREEERCYGGDDWRRAASRAVMQAG